MTSMLQIDLEKFEADLNSAVTEAEAARDRVAKAVADAEEADRRVDQLRTLLAAMARYAAPEGTEAEVGHVDPLAFRASRPLAGLTAKAAVAEFTRMKPGQVVKLGDLYEQMKGLGFDGTENSLSVAIGALVKNQVIQRTERRGYYRLGPPTDTDGTFEEGRLIQE